jgi:hypothetical protein
MTEHNENAVRFSPFWPLCIMAASVAIFLGWQVVAAGQQYIALVRLGDQQTALSGQATQAEGKLQAMVMDLLGLSKTNAAALAIVNKHGIKFTPPATPPPALPTEAVLPEVMPKPD